MIDTGVRLKAEGARERIEAVKAGCCEGEKVRVTWQWLPVEQERF